MALEPSQFRQVLPAGTNLETVLWALRDVAGLTGSVAPSLVSRPWFSDTSCGIATAWALCALLGCPMGNAGRVAPPHFKEHLWQHLWENRHLWSSLLPPRTRPAAAAAVCATLQEASLCFALGLHPRVGIVSPVRLLSPIFAREFVCSYLAPPAAFVALFIPAVRGRLSTVSKVLIMLERPGHGIMELKRPMLPAAPVAQETLRTVMSLCARTGELFNSLPLQR
eukprot:m51a1_g12558 hypothetical protein (224) ;mRNA; r:951-3157